MEKQPNSAALRRQIEALERDCQSLREKEAELVDQTNRYRRLVNTIACAVYEYVRWPDGRSSFIYMSPQCESIFEYTSDKILSEPELLWNMIHPDDIHRLRIEDEVANQDKYSFHSEVRIQTPSGQCKWIELTGMPSTEQYEGQLIWSGVVLDISVRKQAEAERDQLITELKVALSEVNRLSGLLPICAWCKKVRDDSGYWGEIESYISSHSQAQFSHSVCPECATKLASQIKRKSQPFDSR